MKEMSQQMQESMQSMQKQQMENANMQATGGQDTGKP
jgi:hypothetical protein